MNADKWIETYIKEYQSDKEYRNGEMGCLLIGAMQMYEACGEELYLQFIEEKLKCYFTQAGEFLYETAGEVEISSLDYGRILFFMYQRTGKEAYRSAIESVMCRIRELPWNYRTLPFYMLYETKCGKKEKYNDIVKQFVLVREKLDKAEVCTYLMALVDTMDNMSIEIYEKYRELQDIYKSVLKESLGEDKRDIRLAYSILKACRMGILLKEKYADIGMKMAESLFEERMSAKDAKTCLYTGDFMMAYAQYLMLQKEME